MSFFPFRQLGLLLLSVSERSRPPNMASWLQHPVMAVEELLPKIRELEEGQAELKQEIFKLVPEQQ